MFSFDQVHSAWLHQGPEPEEDDTAEYEAMIADYEASQKEKAPVVSLTEAF